MSSSAHPLDEYDDLECSECTGDVAHTHTVVDGFGFIYHHECVWCDAAGRVEVRPEDSPAEHTGTLFHGCVTPARKDEP